MISMDTIWSSSSSETRRAGHIVTSVLHVDIAEHTADPPTATDETSAPVVEASTAAPGENWPILH